MSDSKPSVADLQKYVKKEAIIHVIQDDGSTEEITATIQAATAAGVPVKVKGKAGLDLLTAEKIEEIDFAPVKAKSVSKKKLAIIEYGQARQHLLDRHGVELEWAKNADEKSAFEYHAGLDHTNLGHEHIDKDAEAKANAEREAALANAS